MEQNSWKKWNKSVLQLLNLHFNLRNWRSNGFRRASTTLYTAVGQFSLDVKENRTRRKTEYPSGIRAHYNLSVRCGADPATFQAGYTLIALL